MSSAHVMKITNALVATGAPIGMLVVKWGLVRCIFGLLLPWGSRLHHCFIDQKHLFQGHVCCIFPFPSCKLVHESGSTIHLDRQLHNMHTCSFIDQRECFQEFEMMSLQHISWHILGANLKNVVINLIGERKLCRGNTIKLLAFELDYF